MTSNMIHIVALGSGFKYPCKIHLNTQCPSLTLLTWAYYTQVLHCAKTPWPRNRSRPQRQRNADDVEATTRELEKSRQKGLI